MRSHPGFADYGADEDGQIFGYGGRKLKGNKSGGFLSVNLIGEGKKRGVAAHRFVYECFLGSIPEGQQVVHRDGDSLNNAIDNLELLPPGEHHHRPYSKRRRTVVVVPGTTPHPTFSEYSADERGHVYGPFGDRLRGNRCNGFLGVCLKRVGASKKSMLFHRFVYECFYGSIPEGQQVAHRDGNHLHNAPGNLQLLPRFVRKMRSYAKRAVIAGAMPSGANRHPTYDRYSANEAGVVFGPSGRPLSGTLHLGYRCVTVSSTDGRKKCMLAHRFIYECFRGLLQAGLEVDHIDGGRCHNALINLQALTRAAHQSKTRATVTFKYGGAPACAPNDEEVWACPRWGGGWQVSSHGRFRLARKIKLGPKCGPYRVLQIKRQRCTAHVAVALTFLGRRPSELHTVDHIDRDPLNNRVDNLRWATKYEQGANTSTAVSVQAIDSNDEVVGTWLTQGAAARATNTHAASISKVISGECKQTAGLRWRLTT